MLNIVFQFLLFLHPFYVSVTTVDKKEDRLEISSRIFYDDLETALKEEFGGKVDLHNNQQKAKNTQLLEKYFQKYFSIKEDGSPISYDFLGFNLEGEAAWCYLEVKGTKPKATLEFQNKLLYSYFKEQIHIFHVNSGKSKKSGKITNPESQIRFELP
ncbi:DUF6702 family protein [Leadbetterella byssophila]|uniref:Uncharacterized protein n=1 Tax=Leadbetterella byssophila (strain DSM 17132 / JCM 16389 / KACC 11308 / NBRC 106382 / 4M15) TaxID=649349 RepID=E4RYL4_LEAB4|nr:DUF6702 family protein [Leadbetterella byssophila]ADQ19144.1 hypothetical protein Lbys_3496 [Leadbetterella byssophila DSM 17132]